MRSAIDLLQFPPKLAFHLFAVFSRIEFSLKEMGYVRPGPGGRAECDWFDFARSVNTALSIPPNESLSAAIAYLNGEPPLIQVYEDGRAVWRATPLKGASAVERAFESARRVRNNLFHGGKHTPDSAPGRDEQLVSSAIILFEACVERVRDLRNVYDGVDS